MGTKAANRIYNSKTWKLVRNEALRLAGYRCHGCGRFRGLQCHHKRPLSEGGDAFDLDNVAVLCHGCHVLRHHPDAKLPDAKLGRKLSDWKRFARVVK